MTWQTLLPFVKAALIGAASAAVVDYRVFKNFKTVEEFKAYRWDVAAFRWAQGAVTGLIGELSSHALGLGGLL